MSPEIRCTFCDSPVAKKNRGTLRPFCNATCYGQWQKGKQFSEQGKPNRPKLRCSVPDCGEPHFGKGHCRKHYLAIVYKRPKSAPLRSKEPPFVCAFCSRPFVAYHEGAKYCSHRCSADARKRPYIVKKGYRKVLCPAHPRADAKGYVFEHVLVMEKELGRPILPTEPIHHKDHNRQNNHPDNLEVFPSHAEHMKHHFRPCHGKEK